LLQQPDSSEDLHCNPCHFFVFHLQAKTHAHFWKRVFAFLHHINVMVFIWLIMGAIPTNLFPMVLPSFLSFAPGASQPHITILHARGDCHGLSEGGIKVKPEEPWRMQSFTLCSTSRRFLSGSLETRSSVSNRDLRGHVSYRYLVTFCYLLFVFIFLIILLQPFYSLLVSSSSSKLGSTKLCEDGLRAVWTSVHLLRDYR